MTPVTSEQVKNAVLSAKLEYIPVRKCSMCGEELYYLVRNEDLFFSSACDCVRYSPPPHPAEWGGIACLINMQVNSEYRAALMRSFGMSVKSGE